MRRNFEATTHIWTCFRFDSPSSLLANRLAMDSSSESRRGEYNKLCSEGGNGEWRRTSKSQKHKEWEREEQFDKYYQLITLRRRHTSTWVELLRDDKTFIRALVNWLGVPVMLYTIIKRAERSCRWRRRRLVLICCRSKQNIRRVYDSPYFHFFVVFI